MSIQTLGELTKDDQLDWHYTKPFPVPVLGGALCQIILERYTDDLRKDDFLTAVSNFLSCSPLVLQEAEPYIFEYYLDVRESNFLGDHDVVSIGSPSDVWSHIQIGLRPVVMRGEFGDQSVYVTLESECDWESEHGLQIVFRNGARICKVGSFDGLPNNSFVPGDPGLDAPIYRRIPK